MDDGSDSPRSSVTIIDSFVDRGSGRRLFGDNLLARCVGGSKGNRGDGS